jgi:uncharacterized glyoxalase superfamily protein PhnB
MLVGSREFRTGSGLVMIGPGIEDFGTRAVEDPEWATCRIHVFVPDLDQHHELAVAEGATIISDPAKHFDDVRIYIAADCGSQQWIFAEPLRP